MMPGPFLSRYEIVGDVRGKGLMIGIEMVANKESRAPLDAQKMMKIWDRTRDAGVLIGNFSGSSFI